MYKKLLAGLVAGVFCVAGHAGMTHNHEHAMRAQLTRIAVGQHRSAKNVARNHFRHPVETLMFFGIRPDMTVVEASPGGGGWYTEILAPFLREKGTYYAGSYDPQSEREYYRRNAARYAEKLAEYPQHYDRVKVTVFAPPEQTNAAPEGSADLVLTFRNTHNWMGNDAAEAAYAGFYSMLKPGGVLGVVQHRAKPGTTIDPGKGYITEEKVVALAQAAGFRLLESSEINANRKDNADHPEGVWTLPPAYRLKDVDREKYAAIGESDRMTLKFVRD
ncbi:MAG: methyltransferase [Gammaproteobacteria bacterium]|nr:methyltransferase [Gammaproteobacteria bacterium]